MHCRILELEEEDVYFYKKRDKLKVKHVQKALESSKSNSKKAKSQEIESNESSVAETEIDSEGNLSSKMPKSSITVAPKSSSIKSQERKTKRKKTKEFEVEEESKKEKSIASNSIRSSKAPKSLRSSSSSSKAPKSNNDHNDGDSSQDEQKSSKTPKGKKEMMTRSKEELVRENLLLREIVNKYRDDVHELTRMQNNDPRVLLEYVVESVLEGLESKLLEINN